MKNVLTLICFIVLSMLITGCGEKKYYCDNGDTLKGTSCVSKNTTPATPVYTCKYNASTYLVGDKCCYSSGICLNARVNNYTCTSGYLQGTNCVIETVYNAYEK